MEAGEFCRNNFNGSFRTKGVAMGVAIGVVRTAATPENAAPEGLSGMAIMEVGPMESKGLIFILRLPLVASVGNPSAPSSSAASASESFIEKYDFAGADAKGDGKPLGVAGMSMNVFFTSIGIALRMETAPGAAGGGRKPGGGQARARTRCARDDAQGVPTRKS